ncbi:hypothetical protein PLESTB_001340900 [Pleodorina starrii]|uniref:Uncharacterized protein n=1 Tax=Pleodorina starrii TaxID=330485 RepID=A0A9W6BU58_9CHLO|nr:hypothetical protein PLESTB_001340900 [Pleodorina starrii]
MPPKRSPAASKKRSAANGKGYEFDAAEDTGPAEDAGPDVESLARMLRVAKGKDAKIKLLKQLASALEEAPQDVSALGGAKDTLPLQLLEDAADEQADKDLRLYGARCIVHVMRVYAPDTPYNDDQLKEVFRLLLFCWERLADTAAAGTFELCRATLQTFADVKGYFPLLDLDDPDLLDRTFGGLLQAARPESLPVLEGPLLVVLSGILEELGQPRQEMCDMVLETLASAGCGGGGAAAAAGGAGPSPGGRGGAAATAAKYTAAAQRLAAQLVTSRDSALRGAVQRQVLSFVRASLQSEAAAGGGGRAGRKAAAGKAAAEGGVPYDTFTLLNGLHASAPLLLLPVVPELCAQLRHEDEAHRSAAADLVMRLLAAPPPPPPAGAAATGTAGLQQASSVATGTLGLGLAAAAPGAAAAAPLAVQCPELLQELLLRFADNSPALRQQMLARTGQLVAVAAAASPDGALERKVLSAARDRLHDFDDRVRAAACRGLCSLAAAAAAGQPPPAATTGAGSPAAAGAAAPPPVLYDNDLVSVLQDVAARLRDRKVTVRKEAAVGLLVAWRGACTAVQQGALSLSGLVRSVGWVPARLCTEALRDTELRPHLMAHLAAPLSPQQLLHHPHSAAGAGGARAGAGMLPPALGQRLGAAVWAALWASYSEAERTAVRKMLALKAQLASELQQLVELRRQLRAASGGTGTGAEAEGEGGGEQATASVQRFKRRLAVLCRSLAREAGGPGGSATRGSEQLQSLVESAKDNFFWDRLSELALPGARPETLAAARKDALSRLPNGGSKSPAADLITRISHTAQATLLSPSHVAGLMAALDAAADGGGGAAAADSELLAAARLAVVAAKSAPALCAAAMPTVVGIVTAEPPRPELACTTAVRVLRHAARSCPVVATGAAAGGAGGSPSPRADGQEEREGEDSEEEGAEGEEEDEDGREEEEEEQAPAQGKRGTRGGAAAAASPPNGAARRTRGQQQKKQEQELQKQMKKGKAGGGAGGAAAAAAGAAAAAEARAALTAALKSLSLGPYPKAAKAAVHALWAVLGPEEGGRVVAQLADQLVLQLLPGREALAATPCIMQAMASVGEVAPRTFAGHADAFSKFVGQNYLTARLRAPPKAAGKGRGGAGGGDGGGGGGGTEWERPSYGIALKVAALRALARACAPDADAPVANAAVGVPPATADAVSSYVCELLVQLLDVEYEMAEYGVAGEVDRGQLRLAAAAALLHLAKRHDSRLTAGAYVALALTMQDPVMEVRQVFGEEVRAFLRSSLQQQQRPHVIAKYAALLPLAGMDPRLEHREAAARSLREVVLLLRVRAQQAALARSTTTRGSVATAATGGDAAAGSGREGAGAAAATSASRPSLSDLPEFLLAFLVYILGHHPDCPTAPAPDDDVSGGEALEAPDPDDYRPFQDMIQFALEPLLAPPPSAAAGGAVAAAFGGAGEALPAVCKVLRSVKLQMQDADETFEPPATQTIRVLADIGIEVAKAVVQREMLAGSAVAGAGAGAAAPAAAAGGGGKDGRQQQPARGKGGKADKQATAAAAAARDPEAVAAAVVQLARREHPGHSVVPVRLFKLVDMAETKGLGADGACLPPGYQVVLSPSIADLGGTNAAAQQPGDSAPTGGRNATRGQAGAGAAPAARGRRDGGGGGGGGSDGEEADEEAGDEGAGLEPDGGGTPGGGEEGEGQQAQPAGKRGSGGRGGGGGAKRKRPEATGGGGKAGGRAVAAARKEPAAKKDAGAGGGGGRGRGAAAARGAKGAKKRRRSSGYESLSEGEPSSPSEEEEEEEEDEEEEEQQEAQPAPKHEAAAAAAAPRAAARGAAAAVAAAKAPLKPPAAAGARRQQQQREAHRQPADEYNLPSDEENDDREEVREEEEEEEVEEEEEEDQGRTVRPAAAGGRLAAPGQQQQQPGKRGRPHAAPPAPQPKRRQQEQQPRRDADEEEEEQDKENTAGNDANGGGAAKAALPTRRRAAGGQTAALPMTKATRRPQPAAAAAAPGLEPAKPAARGGGAAARRRQPEAAAQEQQYDFDADGDGEA